MTITSAFARGGGVRGTKPGLPDPLGVSFSMSKKSFHEWRTGCFAVSIFSLYSVGARHAVPQLWNLYIWAK